MKAKKQVFPMGYQKPKASAYADTPAGQKQSPEQVANRLKAALKADMRGAAKKAKPSRPIKRKR